MSQVNEPWSPPTATIEYAEIRWSMNPGSDRVYTFTDAEGVHPISVRSELEALNAFGSQGWDLFSRDTWSLINGPTNARMILKRTR